MTIPKGNSLKKKDRLKSKRLIDYLFNKDNQVKIVQHPLILLAKKGDVQAFNDSPAKVLFSVSKKKLKRAVDRNFIKRKLREGYRKNKNKLYSVLIDRKEQLLISFIYIDNNPQPQEDLEEKIIVLLDRLIKKIDKPS